MAHRNNENKGHFKIHLFVHPPRDEEKDRDPKRLHRGRKGNPLWKHGGARTRDIKQRHDFRDEVLLRLSISQQEDKSPV